METKNQYQPDFVSPPGETLADVLEDRDMTQAQLAIRMGRPKKTINEIIQGKAAIVPETALQLERVLGVPAGFWLAREQHYRESVARRAAAEDLGGWTRWANDLPLAELRKRGWVTGTGDGADMVRECLEYFGVASPTQWKQVYHQPLAAFRKSTKVAVDDTALACWVRRGELLAGTIATAPYDETRFMGVLHRARAWTHQQAEEFAPQLQRSCADAGVAVVFVAELKNTPVSGIARFLSQQRALIQLSHRYKTNDHFWFSFFHEAAHILLHSSRLIFLDIDDGSTEPLEVEANRFAADHLIPAADYERFRSDLADTSPSRGEIEAFAASIGVDPGVVVGRLQHDGLLSWKSPLNKLKKRLQWASIG